MCTTRSEWWGKSLWSGKYTTQCTYDILNSEMGKRWDPKTLNIYYNYRARSSSCRFLKLDFRTNKRPYQSMINNEFPYNISCIPRSYTLSHLEFSTRKSPSSIAGTIVYPDERVTYFTFALIRPFPLQLWAVESWESCLSRWFTRVKDIWPGVAP
jgi:hypothetical protein